MIASLSQKVVANGFSSPSDGWVLPPPPPQSRERAPCHAGELVTAPGAHQPARPAGPFFRVDFLFHLDTCCLLGFYVPGVKGRRPWAPPRVCGGACAGCRSEWGPRGGDPSPAPSAQLLRSLSFFPFLGQTQFLKSLCVCALGSSYVWSSAVSAVPNHSQPVAPLCPGLRSPRRGCPAGPWEVLSALPLK